MAKTREALHAVSRKKTFKNTDVPKFAGPSMAALSPYLRGP